MNEPSIQLNNNGEAATTALMIAREIVQKHFQGLPHERQDPEAQATMIAAITERLLKPIVAGRFRVFREEPPDSNPGCARATTE